MIATATLMNRSWKTIVQADVLVDTNRAHLGGGKQLFEARVHLGPGEIRSAEGISVGRYPYDFKSSWSAGTGCELDRIVFADGTNWIAPSPL